jgi:hypothetical protein
MLALVDDRYNNTVIYKLVCNDPSITDCYVGKTFDLKIRYSKHKSACYNKKSVKNNYKVYKFIRTNGGFENFSMAPIACYNCANVFESKLKELFHIEELKATLNTQKPSVFVITKDYHKNYRMENKLQIHKRKNTWHQCLCGGCYTMANRAQHHRSLKHTNFITMYNAICVLSDQYLETGKINRESLIWADIY